MRKLKKLTAIFASMTLLLFFYFFYPLNKVVDYQEEDTYINTMEYLQNRYQEIGRKIQPYIVYASVNLNNQVFLCEIIEDKNNGEFYHVKNDTLDTWVDAYYVTLLDMQESAVEELNSFDLELYLNYNQFDSETNYFVWVDLSRELTYIFLKENHYFFLLRTLKCSTGSQVTPTKRGLYKIENKGHHFYGRDKTYLCYYWLQYSGSYLFHSFPYDFNGNVLDSSLQQRVSNGCIRLSYEDAYYFYHTIPLNSSIWIH